VAENVCLGHWPRRHKLVSRRAMRAVAAKRLGALGLDHLDLDAPVSSLPVVDQAFVQISRAMTPGARVLITDEPTAPMGADQAERLLNLLVSITQQGVAIVFVSHRLDEVFRLGHEVVVLRDGRKVAEESVASVTKDQLVSAMLGARELGQDQRDETAETAHGAAALSVRGLTGNDLVDVSIDVRGGEVVAVYGSAGSGRDQLGRLIFGSSPRSAGQVLVSGKQLEQVSPRASIAAGIGYVPAERRSQGLILDASIRENLVLASMGQLSSRGLMRRRAERDLTRDWMNRLHLASRSTETPVASLSGGNQQKVLLARWLSRRPPILILDEPTRGVDVGTKADIYSMLWQAAAQGAAVLVISSDIEEVARVADRVIVLRGGRVTSQLGRTNQQEVLTAAMGVSAHV
jgi:rhamnose transport system ATP-binding protein